jgi:hypothetical protein
MGPSPRPAKQLSQPNQPVHTVRATDPVCSPVTSHISNPVRPTHPLAPMPALTQSSHDQGSHMLNHFSAVLSHFALVLSHFMIFISHFTTMLSNFAIFLSHFVIFISHFAIVLGHFCDFISHF